jgi:hypothetical protein
MRQTGNLLTTGGLVLLLASVCLVPGSSAWAQDNGTPQKGTYQTGENPPAASANNPSADNKQPASEPARTARFDYVSGNVTWRPDDNATWTKAAVNKPLRPGAQIWVTEGGRAEIRFDDGSLLRIGNGTVATLQTLYSDDQGKFTQINMTSGLITLRLRQQQSIYQVDTPINSIKAAGPARVRVGVGATTEIGVRVGRATIEGKQGKITVNAGGYLVLQDASTPYKVQSLPGEDSWELWNDERDRILWESEHHVHVYPPYGPTSSFGLFLGIPLGSPHGHWGWHRW